MIASISVLLLCVHLTQAQLGCKSGADAPVDWFIAYKLPTKLNAFHLTPAALEFPAAPTPLIDAATPLKATIDQFLTVGPPANPGDPADPDLRLTISAVAYSNYAPTFRREIPLTPSKGLIMIGAAAANPASSWIVHTFPKFPDMTQAALAYVPPRGSGIALCMTIAEVNIPNIFEVMTYADTIMYFNKIGATVAALAEWEDPLTQAYFNGAVPQTSPYMKVISMKTVGNVPITTIGKYTAASVDLLSRYVAVVLKAPLKVRFDTTARDALPNHCIASTPTSNLPGRFSIQNVPFPAADERAVWAVDNANKNIFCVSSAPRTTRHQSLGSMATCITQADVYAAFNALATTIIPAPVLCK